MFTVERRDAGRGRGARGAGFGRLRAGAAPGSDTCDGSTVHSGAGEEPDNYDTGNDQPDAQHRGSVEFLLEEP